MFKMMISQFQSLRFPLHPSKNPNSKPLKPSRLLIAAHLQTTSFPITDSGLLFREKLIYLEKLNIDCHKALKLNPDIRSTPLSSLLSVEQCLTSMGIERSALGRILDMLPQLLTANPDSDLYPVFDFLLNEVNIPYPNIRKSIMKCPRLLICSVNDQLRPTLGFLKGLGFVGREAINYNTTLLLVSSIEGTLLPKFEFLQNLGFSPEEVGKMVVRSPGLLTFSISNNYKPKLAYFLEEMKGDLEELKRFPQYFSFSLEGKIKPRHQLLVQHGFSLPLSKMLKISDGEFNARMIEMRLQVVDGR